VAPGRLSFDGQVAGKLGPVFWRASGSQVTGDRSPIHQGHGMDRGWGSRWHARDSGIVAYNLRLASRAWRDWWGAAAAV